MSGLVPIRVLSTTAGQLSFELIRRIANDAVYIGGPAFTTIPLDKVPPELRAIGRELVLRIAARHELVSVESLPMRQTEVNTVVSLILRYTGRPEEFLLHLAPKLTLHGESVASDVAYAIITDAVLSKGWVPDGVYELSSGRLICYAA